MCADCNIKDALDTHGEKCDCAIERVNMDNEETHESFVEVHVRNPITHNVNGGSYTSYDIVIETNSRSFTMRKSEVRRRFSDFYQLRQLLSEQLPYLTPPSLPYRTFLLKRFGSAFIEDRRKGLEDFLTELLSEDLYLSSKCVHLFLQSDLGMDEIRDVVTESPIYYTAESKPPIVLALHDEAVEKACSDATDSNDSADGSTKPPKGILRKSLSATSLHSFKCPMDYAHCHLRIGSRIRICQPTLSKPETGNKDGSCPGRKIGDCPVFQSLKASASDPCLEKARFDTQKNVFFERPMQAS